MRLIYKNKETIMDTKAAKPGSQKKKNNETGFKISYRCVLTKKHGERDLFKQFKK